MGLKVVRRKRTVRSALRGIGHWFAVRAGSSPTYTAHIRELGLTYTVPMDTIFSWHLAKYRVYEPDITNWVIGHMAGDRNALYVDVGANFGWYTCLMARHGGPGCQVIAFEPDPSNLALLRNNLAQNQCGNVQVVAQGVGRAVGEALFHRAHAQNPGMHSFVPMSHLEGNSAGEVLAITTLDAALAGIDRPVGLIKIDIEGYEHDALLGARETLARTRGLILEYSPAFLRKAGHDPMEPARYLLSLGFALFELRGEAPVPLTLERLADMLRQPASDFFQFDLVALR